MIPFSQRYGYKSIRQSLQLDNIDRDLKNGLWNAYYTYFVVANEDDMYNNGMEDHIWKEFFKNDISLLDYRTYGDYVREWFFESIPWYEIYDFLEFCCNMLNSEYAYRNLKGPYTDECNRILEREMSAYRFVDCSITRIISEVEIDAIEEATNNTDDRWAPVAQHLHRALNLFSNRQSPDYPNSIKESISAVESACKIITREDSATLGKMLIVLEGKQQIPQALKAAFSSLYGYTSNEGGIRHALTDSTRIVTFDEAKFMLVACSAFSNYLRPHLS